MPRSGNASLKRMLFGVLAVAMLAGMSPRPPAKTVEATPAAYQAWRNAIVQIAPKVAAPDHRGIFGRLRHVEPFFATLRPGIKLPAVLYLHDCPGLKIEAVRDIDELAALGYAVFAPDSFDSRDRKSDCVRFEFVAGLNPDAYWQRQSEILVAGNCGAYMSGYKYAQSVVIENHGLHHITWMNYRASEAVRDFVKLLMPPQL